MHPAKGRPDRRTGRAVVLPNSVWLSGPAINETFTSAYVLQTVTVPLKLNEPRAWEEAEARLLEAAQAECAEFLEDARRHLDAQGEAKGLTTPTVEPRVSLHAPDPDRIDLILRFPAPSARPGNVEQAILRRYFGARP